MANKNQVVDRCFVHIHARVYTYEHAYTCCMQTHTCFVHHAWFLYTCMHL